ncbi:MAG: glutamate--tRNA ligase [Conexivisphaerales archaeon]
MDSSLDRELELSIRMAALLNATRHHGKADVNAVLGKVLSEYPEFRAEARKLVGIVQKICKEVSSMTELQQREELISVQGKMHISEKAEVHAGKKEESHKELPALPNVQRYDRVVTRFAPNPDSVLHIGSTRALILSHDYARMYSGRFILRFEDTDPRLKKSSLKFYDYIIEDMRWMGCEPDEIYFQSDRLEIYYTYAERLIQLGGAYVCTCSSETFRSHILAGQSCPCRNLTVLEHLNRWKKMLSGGYKEGEAVLRVKTDLTHPNPAVRDWPAMRIIDTQKYKHPRVGSKYIVWPLYNWSAGLDDHLMGVTHIIRGKDHLTNAIRQKYFYDAFGWNYPESIHYGRLKIEGSELSKSKIEFGIREGRYYGYDDPRLATLRALKRRGIESEAIRRLIYQIGPKPVDVEISWDNLLAINRQLIDRKSPRHFAVFSPVMLEIAGIPDEFLKIELPRHPDNPGMGKRVYEVRAIDGKARVYVPRTEIQKLKSARLMGLFNISDIHFKEDASAKFYSYSLEDARKRQMSALQWLPVDSNIQISVVLPDASSVKGLGDTQLLEEEVGVVVQFERMFFARIDSKQPEFTLYFTSGLLPKL